MLTIKLYRAISDAEFHDLIGIGKFRSTPGSLEGKWFALRPEDAKQWGNILHGVGNYRIIEVEVSEKTADQFFKLERLDNIGPAAFAEIDQLGITTFVEVLV